MEAFTNGEQMSILNIREAEREGARLVFGISGVSGSGKTFTALQIAWGLAGGNSKKVGLLDAENKRGSLYSDSLVGKDGQVNKFMIGDLYAPFSPQRYAGAIKEFQEAGVEVLVIDSASLEWEGEGGCEDIADDGGKVANWKKAKREHKRFMNTLLTCDMHIIVCLRAREKTSFKDPRAPQSLGIQPICEKNFMFELTASVMIHDQGTRRDILKCPADLLQIVDKPDGYLGAKEGLAIRRWVDGGAKLDPEVERARNTILSHAAEGLAKVEEIWGALPAKTKKALGQSFIDMARSSAQAFDDQREQQPGIDPISLDSGFNPAVPIEREVINSSPAHVPLPDADGDPFSMNDQE